MKRFLIILMCAAFVAGTAVPTRAVEKKEKTGTTQQAPQKAKPTPPPAKKPAVKTPPKYDDFVDRNHNGIDDRKETTKIKDDQQVKPKTADPKAGAKKADDKKPVEKKPPEKKPGS